MNQTWENGKEPNFRSDFGLFGPNLPPSPRPQKYFHGLYLCYLLEIVASYLRIQFQGKLIIQTQENGEKPHFGPDSGPLDPNLGQQLFFQKSGFLVIRCHGQLSQWKISEKN